jgi:two-component system, cell cycle sensor histidine kinase and response regulator CckA
VFFPRVDVEAEPPPSIRRNTDLPRGSETLLVVEDDPDIRDLARTMLRAQGYHVLCGANGREGLEVARAHVGRPIQMVITDVVMPQMDGKTMSEAIRAILPTVKVLFTSGYTDESSIDLDLSRPGFAFLPKPYSVSALCTCVRQMLDK